MLLRQRIVIVGIFFRLKAGETDIWRRVQRREFLWHGKQLDDVRGQGLRWSFQLQRQRGGV
jgi:hypothetical protein